MGSQTKISIMIFAAICYQHVCRGQFRNVDTIRANRISEKIVFDGKLDEAAWQVNPGVENFTQRELEFGKPASEKTKVVVLYDRSTLYIGVWCFQRDIKTLHAKYMQRDFIYDEDDNFQLALSPFNDKRNGYLFVINPNGARADLLISGNEEANKDWNGVWDVKTSVTSEGWFAEIRIPFSSLQFKRESAHNWAVNFERDIRSRNEQALWRGWTRDCSIFCLVNAGKLVGLDDIGYEKRFELKPYILGGFEQRANEESTIPAKVGGDLNINLTPTLKFNFTANTDFAQVEADRVAVNLTRFNLYYPEKREFFLEGYQNFQFSLGSNNQLFYTRKIGNENLRSVPVIAGGRLFGKIGTNNIGLLNIQTAGDIGVSSTNNTVIRYKRDIGSQSYIGGIVTAKLNTDTKNEVVGVDGAYSTSHFLKNKNLVIGGYVARSFDRNAANQNTTAWRFFIDYPNDLIDHFIGISGIQKNFNPTLGFLARTNYESFTWNMRYYPRWFTKYGIRKMSLKPWEFTVYRTQTTGELESFYNESRPLGFYTKSGESVEFNLQQQYDRIDSAFNVTDSVGIGKGKYWMFRQEARVTTFQARKLWIRLSYNWGGYYSGRIRTIQSSVGVNVSKHFNFRTDYTNNQIAVSSGHLSTNELAEYINYAFTPRLDMSAFVQWNSLDDLLFGNLRLHYIPNIGSDLYVVYNRGYEDLKRFDLMRPKISAGAVKLVWRIIF